MKPGRFAELAVAFAGGFAMAILGVLAVFMLMTTLERLATGG